MNHEASVAAACNANVPLLRRIVCSSGMRLIARSDVSQLIRGYDNIKVKNYLFALPEDFSLDYEGSSPLLKRASEKCGIASVMWKSKHLIEAWPMLPPPLSAGGKPPTWCPERIVIAALVLAFGLLVGAGLAALVRTM
jgi:hypothetical protein